MEIGSTDYRDYIIKDGKFVGAFEGMYRNCSDPWQQDQGGLAEDVALFLVSRQTPHRILDIGCGKGRFTDRVKAATGAVVTALDVSVTAARAARVRLPDVGVVAARVPPLPFASQCFDLVVSAELLWYVLDDLQFLFGEISRVLRPSGRYLIIQHFYKPGEQGYGKEVMQTPLDLLKLLPFQVDDCVEINRFTNHKLVACLSKVSPTRRDSPDGEDRTFRRERS